MNYRLEKIAVEKSSDVHLGSSVEGMLLVGNDTDADETIDDIKIGSTILVGRNMYQMIKTSSIVEILQKTENMVLFKTQTSTYMLEKIND